MIIFHFSATPTATRSCMPGLLLSAEGRTGFSAASAPMTGTKAPLCAGVTGGDRPEASLGNANNDGFYTVPVRVFAAPKDVPGVRAWSPPV